MIVKIGYTLTLLYGSMAVGYFARRKGYVAIEKSTTITKVVMIFLIPAVNCLSFWILDISHVRIFGLPLVGIIVMLSTILPAKYLSKFHRLSQQETGSYITSALFSNVGFSLGGFLCFLLLGEEGYGLSVIYGLGFSFCLYVIGFYIAAYYGSVEGKRMVKNTMNTFVKKGGLPPLLGIVVGICLNVFGINRPEVCGTIFKGLIPISTFFLLFAAGLTFKSEGILKYKKTWATISLIKFLYSPIIGLLGAYLIGYSKIPNRFILKVVFIEASMPVAISSLMLSNLFRLEKDLTNSCWAFTNVFMVVIVPIIIMLAINVL